MTDCRDRCQRQHPHPVLRMSRAIAPADRWFWTVEHRGHAFAVSASYESPAACAMALATDGVEALSRCEAALAAVGDW